MATPIANVPSDRQPAEEWTPELGLRLWADLMDSCEQLLLLGLRQEIGPDGDIQAAYRRWQAVQREEHDRAVDQLVANMNRRLEQYGR